MNYTKLQWWERFQKYYTEFPTLGLAVDLSRMNVDDAFFAAMEPKIQKALADMAALEAGAIANPDENRMVGHYWLRNPALAPTPEIRKEIEDALRKSKLLPPRFTLAKFVARAERSKIICSSASAVRRSARNLSPMRLAIRARTNSNLIFSTTPIPDGMDRVLATIGDGLNRTLCIVISKSGGTKETRNGMLVAKAAFEKAGLDFGKHTVAVTSAGSELDKYAMQNKWLERFPMWDWVGGRTSELSASRLAASRIARN